MVFKAFKFSTPLIGNINVLSLGGKSTDEKIQPEHSPGISIYLLTYMRVLQTLFVTRFLDGEALPTLI